MKYQVLNMPACVANLGMQVQDLLAVSSKRQNLRVREHSILGPYVEG